MRHAHRIAAAIAAALLAACGSTTTPTAAPATATPAAAPAPTPAPATAAHVVRYSIVINGRAAGGAETTIAPDGTRTTHYEYNDRGRGPDLTTRIVLSADGIPRELDVKGLNYTKAQVTEQLRPDGAGLAWSGTSEKGASADATAFYVPSEGPFDSSALLARALQKAPGHRLKLLPGGEAWIEAELHAEPTVDGHPRKLTGVAIAGLGFSPDLVWIDEDGELFADVSPWRATTVEGAEQVAPELLAAEQTWRAERAGRLAQQLAHPIGEHGLVVTHARLFDPVKKAIRDDVSIVIEGEKVVKVGPSKSTKVPTGADVIDAGGKTVLPGLFDMHAHMGGTDGLLDIQGGVTTARDMGNNIEDLTARRERYVAGTEIGPRLLRAGFIDGPGKFTGPIGLVVASADEARAAVTRYADLGYDQIKIYSSVDPALVPVIAEAAHARGLRVSGHIPQGMNARQAVEAGYDEIQHSNFLFLNFLAKPEDDTRTPVRFTLVAEGAAGLDLASPEMTSFVDLLKKRKTVIDPTLSVFEELFVSRAGEVPVAYAPVAPRMPAQVQRGFLGGGLPVPDGKDARYRDSFRAMQKLVLLLWQRGVRIVPGTDAMAGFALHRELELWVEAGIPAKEVLALATLGAAQVMGKDKELGSIAPGKMADLVIVDGDPVADIKAVRRTETIVTRGRVFKAAEIDQALGIQP